MQREVYTAYIHPYQRSTYNYRPKSLHRAEEHAADQRSNPLHKRKFPFLVRVKKVLHITHAFITIYIKRTANRKPNLSVYILATQVIHDGKKHAIQSTRQETLLTKYCVEKDLHPTYPAISSLPRTMLRYFIPSPYIRGVELEPVEQSRSQ
jgi:hypothetical protein